MADGQQGEPEQAVAGHRVEHPQDIAPALKRCQRAMHAGRPYLVDVFIERHFAGKDSTWYDKFSIAKRQPRIS